MELERTLNETEAAMRLQMMSETLKKWRQRGKGPKYLKVGGRVRYRLSDLTTFLEASVVDPSTKAKHKAGVRRSHGTRRGSR